MPFYFMSLSSDLFCFLGFSLQSSSKKFQAVSVLLIHLACWHSNEESGSVQELTGIQTQVFPGGKTSC